MTTDTKMVGNSTSSDVDASKDAVVDTATSTGTTNDAVSLPPLVLAALRLEKILYDHNENINANSSSNNNNNNNKYESYYMNPIKVIRRWLGTSSGATSSTSADGTKGTGITIEDIQTATKLLLNPALECTQMGRTLLLSKDLMAVSKPDGMDTTDDMVTVTTTATGDVNIPSKDSYVTIASAREVESWLFSLMIRTLWKQQAASSPQFIQVMMTFANEALLISTGHLESTSPIVKTSMYPFIARLYRFAALAYESYSAIATTAPQISSSNDMLSTMSKAHTLATVRRDVDTQATILNIMLREMLRHAQGTISVESLMFLSLHDSGSPK